MEIFMDRYFFGLLLAAFCSVGFAEQAGATEEIGQALHCTDGDGNALRLWAGKHIHGDLTIQPNHGLPVRYQIDLGPQYGQERYEVLSAYPEIAQHSNGDIYFDHPTSFLSLADIRNASFRLTHEGSMHEKIILHLNCSSEIF